MNQLGNNGPSRTDYILAINELIVLKNPGSLARRVIDALIGEYQDEISALDQKGLLHASQVVTLAALEIPMAILRAGLEMKPVISESVESATANKRSA